MRRIHSFFTHSGPQTHHSKLALSLLALLLLTAAGCNSKPSAARTDDAVTADVQGRIAAESALGGQSIQVSVASGVATLNGVVDSDAARSLAANDAAQVQGVRTVVNNLTVVAAQSNPAPIPHPSHPAPVLHNSASVTPPDRKHKDKDKKDKHPATPPPPPPAQVAAVEPPPAPAPLPPPPPEPVQQVAPPPPPQPIVKTITIPDGTTVAIRITESLDSETAVPGSPFHGVLATDLISDGVVAIAHGSNVVGRIADAKDAAHYKGSALLSLELTELSAGRSRIPVVTEPLVQEGPGRGGNTAKKVGGGAVLGAIIGGIAGGGKGAAIGSVAGAGVGAGANTVTRGQQVKIESESLLRFRLQSPINVTVTIKPASARSSDENSNPDPALESRPN